MLFKATAQACVHVCDRETHTRTHTRAHTHTCTHAHRLIYRPVAPAETVAGLELSRQCQQREHQGWVWGRGSGTQLGVQFLFPRGFFFFFLDPQTSTKMTEFSVETTFCSKA